MPDSFRDPDSPQAWSGITGRLTAAHDLITQAGYYLGVAMVAMMAASFCYEVVARYLFGAPTSWANALVSYALCIAIFGVLPELTRTNAHIVINLLLDRANPRWLPQLIRTIQVLAAIGCLVGAAICIDETWRQFLDGIDTISVYPVPKWWISVFIPYGLLSSGLYFVRLLTAPIQPVTVSV